MGEMEEVQHTRISFQDPCLSGGDGDERDPFPASFFHSEKNANEQEECAEPRTRIISSKRRLCTSSQRGGVNFNPVALHGGATPGSSNPSKNAFMFSHECIECREAREGVGS